MKILVTGGSGTIGTIIREDVKGDFAFTFVDNKVAMKSNVSYFDVAQSPALLVVAQGSDAIVHLAWDGRETWKSGVTVEENKTMAQNVYRTAVAAGVKRVIMASSIHADSFATWRGPGLMTCDRFPVANNLYGLSKLHVEALGRYYAYHHGLEVICVRFGGVVIDDAPRRERDWNKIWLSRRDCASLIKCCLEADTIPGNSAVFYGVSDNALPIHDWSNPFGWEPQDGLR